MPPNHFPFSSAYAQAEWVIYGRRHSANPLTLNQKKAYLWRTLKKTPEVVLKVSGGGKHAAHVKAHLDYITRQGALEALTDEGDRLSQKEALADLVESWDFDMSKNEGRYQQTFNLVFSMPKKTDAQKLLQAVQVFCQKTFYGEHAYLMVLHTNEIDPKKNAPEHPHVHVVVKAENFDGKRLHIRKATLRDWREHFAECLREKGIEANATPRYLRGVTQKSKKPSIINLEKRQQSFVLKNKVNEVAQSLKLQNPVTPIGEHAVIEKRKQVLSAFSMESKVMYQSGDPVLSQAIIQFAQNLPKIETERATIQKKLLAIIEKNRAKEIKPTKEQDSKER